MLYKNVNFANFAIFVHHGKTRICTKRIFKISFYEKKYQVQTDERTRQSVILCQEMIGLESTNDQSKSMCLKSDV